MKRFLTATLFASSVLAGTDSAVAQEIHVAVLIDGSGSYGIMHDETYAARIADDLMSRLPTFKMRDRITVMPIGDYSYVNPVKEVQISKRFPASKVGSALKGLVLSFPESIRKRGEPKSTNIMGALAKLSRRMDCSPTEGHVFVLSDGAETGQTMALPSAPLFKGCARFVMIGVTGETPTKTQELGDFWMDWCKAAGFASCDWLS